MKTAQKVQDIARTCRRFVQLRSTTLLYLVGCAVARKLTRSCGYSNHTTWASISFNKAQSIIYLATCPCKHCQR